jgi:hypothetical protein
MSSNQTMYEENVYFPDVFKGCKNDCVYCRPSFQRQAKRQKQRCEKCYTFEPHFHPERLLKKSPATIKDQFVFFPKGGDPWFASEYELECMLQYIRNNPQTTFLMQTKLPGLFSRKVFYNEQNTIPSNLILGITLETNRDWFLASKYRYYSQISKAMNPSFRAVIFRDIPHNRKFVTIEPILQFDFRELIEKIDAIFWCAKVIEPRVIYVGYDTKKCNLPEPTLAETMQLITRLEEKGFTVRRKTLRNAWYE